MRALHLFAGAGGSMLAGRLLGWSSVGAVEIDPFCCRVLEARGEKVLGNDICEFDGRTVRPVDVVCGGFPCQDVSIAGRRKGAGHGTRSGLWREMLRVWEETEAPYLFAENVRGLLGSGGGRDLARFMGALADIGADAVWRVFRASDAGAPHRRERWFILAHARRACLQRWRGPDAVACEVRAPESHRAQREWSGDAAGDCGACSEGVGQADTQKHGWGEGRGVTSEWPRGCGLAPGSGGGEGVALGNTAGGGCWASHPGSASGLPHQTGDALGVTVGAGLAGHGRHGAPDGGNAGATGAPGGAREAEPGVGRAFDGLARWMDSPPRWPAWRGADQFDWESPRTVVGKMPDRIGRLKALGNGWVPQQAALAFTTLWRELHA